MKKYSIVSLLILLSDIFAQNRSEIEYSSFFDSYYFRGPITFNLGGGAVAYAGDLKIAPPSYISGLGASYKVWPRTSFGLQLNYANLKGSDADTTRNISFNTNLMEFYGYCKFFLIDRKILMNQDVYKKEITVRPYITLGLGTIRYSAVSTTTNPAWDKSNQPENVRYPKYGFIVPAGAGLQFFITHRIQLATEFNFRFPFTDYLDEVSVRGETKKDVYYSGELKLLYAPFAPKMKRKKHYKGPIPSGGSGGGGAKAPKEEKPTNIAPEEKPAEPVNNEKSKDDVPPVEDTPPATPEDKPKADDPFADPK